jgi:hypothetical protein
MSRRTPWRLDETLRPLRRHRLRGLVDTCCVVETCAWLGPRLVPCIESDHHTYAAEPNSPCCSGANQWLVTGYRRSSRALPSNELSRARWRGQAAASLSPCAAVLSAGQWRKAVAATAITGRWRAADHKTAKKCTPKRRHYGLISPLTAELVFDAGLAARQNTDRAVLAPAEALQRLTPS